MRAPEPRLWLGLVVTLGACLAGAASSSTSPGSDAEQLRDDLERGHFIFFRSGKPIVLRASPLYAAALILPPNPAGARLTPPDGLELDPRGDRPDLIERGLTLYRVPNVISPRGLETPPSPDAWEAARASDQPIQPVFEHGAVLRIASDEVIVTFPVETTAEDLKRLLIEVWDDLRLLGVEELRPGSFVFKLCDGFAGRAFEISRRLSRINGVLGAEPSFLNVYLETPGPPPDGRVQFGHATSMTHEQVLEAKFLTIRLSDLNRVPAGGVWRLVFDGHFEDDIDKWIVARDEGSNRALPQVVTDRAHEGRRSVFMSGKGLAANHPPDMYGVGISSYLISPAFDVSGFSEVYVELWFRAKLEDPIEAPRQVYDYGRVLLYDLASSEYVYEHVIAPVGPSGDLTRAPGTDQGWRKLMFRIPEVLLGHMLQVHVHFYSDALGGAEGLYVDDLRVLYSAGDGGNPFLRDPAAQFQYAIAPRGQIAGWPGKDDPQCRAAKAWPSGINAEPVVVALLDDGVERDHPDLTFWEPTDDEDETAAGDRESAEGEAPQDGSDVQQEQVEQEQLFPGEPVTPDDRHGTACAGLLGAVANNGIGIAGVAPGARLLPLHRGIDDISIVRAIDAAVGYGAHILVIPWGWTDAAPQIMTRAIVDALDAGVIVVAAAGDGVHRPYGDAVDYPCRLSASTALICVGASSIAGEPKGPASADGLYWWKSAADSTGPDVLAPGTWLHATDRQGPLGYNDGTQAVASDWTSEFSGTGAAACYAAGVAALMLEQDPLLIPEETKRFVSATSTELRWGDARGGTQRLVDPEAAVRAAIESAAARGDDRTDDDAVEASDGP